MINSNPQTRCQPVFPEPKKGWFDVKSSEI